MLNNIRGYLNPHDSNLFLMLPKLKLGPWLLHLQTGFGAAVAAVVALRGDWCLPGPNHPRKMKMSSP
jgi:hypothetical protein